MSKLDKYPAGPFFDAIREWDDIVAARRAKYPGIPEGHMLISVEAMKMWNEVLAEVEAEKPQA